jgi:hypothetical protein
MIPVMFLDSCKYHNDHQLSLGKFFHTCNTAVSAWN